MSDLHVTILDNLGVLINVAAIGDLTLGGDMLQIEESALLVASVTESELDNWTLVLSFVVG